MYKRKKMTRKASKKSWKKGSGMNRRNVGVYAKKNRGGVRF